MSGRAHLILPFASSLIYVFGALWVKRATEFGVGVWRTTFVANCLSAVLFLPLTLLEGPGQPVGAWWQPVLVALLLVGGQTCGFYALTRGDATVATPVLGVKTVVVAGLTPWLLSTGVPTKLWIAAGCSTLGIALLNLAGGGGRRRWLSSVLGALVAAVFFATFDVLVQRWSPGWGAGRFVPMVMGLGALLSLAFIPLFHEPLWKIPKPAWLPLLGGSACISAQGILLITCVAVFGDATAVNVVYSARSLWMVVLVWWIGHWFSSGEQKLGAKVLGGRLAGASFMTLAVVLAVL